MKSTLSLYSECVQTKLCKPTCLLSDTLPPLLSSVYIPAIWYHLVQDDLCKSDSSVDLLVLLLLPHLNHVHVDYFVESNGFAGFCLDLCVGDVCSSGDDRRFSVGSGFFGLDRFLKLTCWSPWNRELHQAHHICGQVKKM